MDLCSRFKTKTADSVCFKYIANNVGIPEPLTGSGLFSASNGGSLVLMLAQE